MKLTKLNNFNPIAPAIIHDKNNNRFTFSSLKKTTPINTAPAAPSPVQIAYAVPIGICCIASDKNTKPNANVLTINAKRASDLLCKYRLILNTPNISPKLAMTR